MSKALRRQLESRFPNLRNSYYKLTSPQDKQYNCIAYAAGDQTKWWDPFNVTYPMVYWPPDAPKDMTLETLCKIFETRGYERCGSGSHEKGFHKVVLYGKSGVVKHAATQLPSKGWSSKLGGEVDIRHDTCSAVSGNEYGDILQFLRKAV